LKENIKEYFTFSRSERKGIVVLVILILFTLTYRILQPFFRNTHSDHSSNIAFQKEILEWEGSIIPVVTSGEKANKDSKKLNLTNAFDPNSISVIDLEKMNIPALVTKAWINYLNKGGRFNNAADLQKIYGMDSSSFYQLLPFVYFSQPEENKKSFCSYEKIFSLELNSVTESDLMKIKGIGPVLSARIIKYRDLLGGYANIVQLKEVYGITDSIFQEIQPFVMADTSLIKKIDLNNDDEFTMARHPYISKNTARGIVVYRKINGRINNTNELLNNRIVNDSIVLKLSSYCR
jgi:competence protein ComEA